MAAVSRTTVYRIEHGRIGSMPLDVVEQVLRVLEMDLDVVARWRGGDIDRLVDEGHAVLAGITAALLETAGWLVRPEVSFSVYGERGSMDLLAWHAPSRSLLVVEIKTTLNSVEETLRRQDVKVRLAARSARERFGWDARFTASALVLPDDATSRRRVQRHAQILDAAFPVRGRTARDWMQRPASAAGLLLFLSDAPREGRIQRIAPRRRVRPPRSQPSGLNGAPGGASADKPGADPG